VYMTVARHSTGYGASDTVFCVSNSICRAVMAVMFAEASGYEFLSVDAGIFIIELQSDVIYKKEKFTGDNLSTDHPVVAFFLKRDGQWHLGSCSLPEVRVLIAGLIEEEVPIQIS
jgi:hypothetical protein